MRAVIRQVVFLVAAVVLFLAVLAALVWGRHYATSEHAVRSSELMTPSLTHIARAQRALIEMDAGLHEHVGHEPVAEAIPFRFTLMAAMQDLDRQLAALTELADAFDYRPPLGLPGRARRQLEDLREALFLPDALTPSGFQRSRVLLTALDGTLQQTERLYRIDQQEALERYERFADRSLRVVGAAIGLLLVVGGGLITRLAAGLREAVRRESRIRSDLEEATRNLEVMAMYDSLTELGNRRLFRARLEQVAAAAGRSGRLAALFYVDLDDFKRINDSLGHDTGDEVLKVVAQRLSERVRAADTVARIGGDEFTVLLSDVASREDLAAVASKLTDLIHEPLVLRGHEIVITASVGITVMPGDSHDPAQLMKNADLALYRAKAQGGRRFQFFVDAMNRSVSERMAMEAALRGAIRRGDFGLVYQPQVDLATGRVACVEALLRWPRPDGTMVPPDQFIPVAEATGQIREIGEWVLMRACQDLVRLRRRNAPQLRMSINLSTRQFREPNLVERVAHALRASDLEPSALEIEITETTLMEDVEVAGRVLGELRDLGISIAIDDFGIGYSSLNYLKHLPISVLKIDRSFVRDIQTDEADRSIVNAILGMAGSLSLRTIAEGVETEWQLDYLTRHGCSVGQGYLFSRPLPRTELSLVDLERRWSPGFRGRGDRGLHLVD